MISLRSAADKIKPILIAMTIGIGSLISVRAAASNSPSWFPKQPCADTWNKKDLAAYKPLRDAHFDKELGNTGYSKYLERLKASGIQRSDCYKDWTVLVYMAADNDLNPYALWDLYEMEGAFGGGIYAGSTLKSDLLVQADTLGRTGIRRLHIFQKPGKTYRAPKGVGDFKNSSINEVYSPIVDYQNETSPTTPSEHKTKLKEFLDWGMRAYPAQNYFVIVWGHGQGWAADSNATDFPGRFGGWVFSNTPGDYLGIPSLSSVLHEVSRDTLEGKPIDVYASDACLMQMVEVANEIAGDVRFVVGSSQVQSYLGLPYRQMMTQINTGRFYDGGPLVGDQDEAYLVARMLPILTEKALHPNLGQQGRADKTAARTFTMSALSAPDLRSRLVPALERMGTQLDAYLREDPFRAMDMQKLIQETPSFMGGMRELGSFIGLLQRLLQEEADQNQNWSKAATTLYQTTEDVRATVQMTSVNYSFGTDYRNQAEPLHLLGFRALGVWLPQNSYDFKARIADFSQSQFYRTGTGSPWAKWLTRVFDPKSLSKTTGFDE